MELLVPAFLAGIITFLAPCTLPLVPAYLSFVSGVGANDTALKQGSVRRKVLFNGLAFSLGFSLVFISLGVLAGFLGASLGEYRVWLSRIGGVFVIFFGLFMLGVIKIPALYQEKTLHPAIRPGNPLSSLLVGSAFAAGWTPCVGPILGSVLVLATTTSTALQGALLMAAFSVGLAIPFLIVAATIGSAFHYIKTLRPYLRAVSFVGGLLLIGIGLLLVTNQLSILISYGYQILEFLNYDEIVQYL